MKNVIVSRNRVRRLNPETSTKEVGESLKLLNEITKLDLFIPIYISLQV